MYILMCTYMCNYDQILDLYLHINTCRHIYFSISFVIYACLHL